MVYQNTLRFLKQHCNPEDGNIDWNKHNDELFLYLNSKHTQLSINENKSEIKVAFGDFFAEKFRTMVLFKDDQHIVLRLMPYQLTPLMSRHFEKLVKLVLLHKESIETKDGVLILPGKLRRKINEEIADSDELVNKSEVIKLAIRTGLALSPDDIIIAMKKNIIVRRACDALHGDDCDENQTPSNTTLSENDIQQLRTTALTDEMLDSVVETVVEYALKNKFDFHTLSQAQFEKRSLTILKYSIVDILTKSLKLQDEQIIELAGYLLRLKFSDIHIKLATHLLQMLSVGHEGVRAFLDRYNGEVVIENNIRYKMPNIESKDGRRWNTMVMSVVAKTWHTNKEKLEFVEKKLQELKPNTPLSSVEEQEKRELMRQKIYFTKQLEQHENSYHGVIEAVATALAKRKQQYRG